MQYTAVRNLMFDILLCEPLYNALSSDAVAQAAAPAVTEHIAHSTYATAGRLTETLFT